MKKAGWITLLVLGFSILFLFVILPRPLFNDPLSRVLTDRNDHLLAASISSDGQWRFPSGVSVDKKYWDALLLFEDKRFYYHVGVDVVALSRAVWQNSKQQTITSGGSTLSMQVIRLSRKGKPRTYFEKIIEATLAVSLELHFSKKEILTLYASHAPYGGNVVGIEAAAWRFLGHSPTHLSWAEAALLAVLPNNPSLLHVGRLTQQLLQKRNRLLNRLLVNGTITKETCALAKAEPLPDEPHPLPTLAQHLIDRTKRDGLSPQKMMTTLDASLQTKVMHVVQNHYARLSSNRIFNAAVLVADVNSGNVLAYVGNTECGVEHNQYVDIISSRRSTGSILKPFLFAAMLKEGKMLPRQLQPDIPVFINGFMPQNFSKSFAGAVPAHHALTQSLNIPAVLQLNQYRYQKFYDLLTDIGITTLSQPADYYGLSIILGGAEGTLWDIVGAYASLGRTLNQYFQQAGSARYRKSNFHPLTYTFKKWDESDWVENVPLTAGEIFQTFDVLKEAYRPGEMTGWQHFNSAQTIAWKTGTSHGLRDGWAVGITANYVVGVWTGNANGEGRPGLTGTEAAAPILFDVFSLLPASAWFAEPIGTLFDARVCRESGMPAKEDCPVDTLRVTRAGLASATCSYHKKIYLSPDRNYQVHSQCESLRDAVAETYFVLPPIQEYFYKKHDLHYRTLPPFRSDCASFVTNTGMMDVIYPKAQTVIHLPRQLSGKREPILFKAAHHNQHATLYWYVDDAYVGTTKTEHKLPVLLSVGTHHLTLIDDHGESLVRLFKVL